MPLPRRLPHYLGVPAIVLIACSQAAAAAAVAVGSGDSGYVGAEQILQVVGGLIFVLLLIAVAAFLARRLKGLHGVGAKQIRIVDGLSVGARDRVLLIEVEDKKVLIGLSPGRIQALHVFDNDGPAFGRALGDAVKRTHTDHVT